MNSLIRLTASRLANVSVNQSILRPFSINSALFKEKTPVDLNGQINSMDDQIKTIQQNEDQYYGAVKKSFDNLQTGRKNESIDEKRSRLLYQSRKRGITENGLLLSNFSAEFIPGMTDAELDEYNLIINSLYNEWDLYYWLTNARPLPEEIKDSKVLKKMIKWCANEDNQERLIMPNLPNLDKKQA